MTTIFVSLDAVDVAMTEASVGAGISSVLLLCCIYLVGDESISLSTSNKKNKFYLFLSLVIGFLLAYGVLGLPEFGLMETPVHQNLSFQFLERGFLETGIPNIVTAILASYRGFDTLGEVVVIFIAGVGVLAVLKKDKKE
jgi:multicomponent Na+:H+ antiporter subunit B